MKSSHLAFLATLGLFAAGATAQNLLHNASFEEVDIFDEPDGWKNFTNAGENYRRIGDGGGPILVRTGVACIELASGNNFTGFTSDTAYSGTGNVNNPPVDIENCGDTKVTGWYAIPANAPLVGTNSCIKLEFRRPNNSIIRAYETLNINGHTNGQWVQFEMIVTKAQLQQDAIDNPPGAVSVSVLPMRFGSFSATGTIFWDDIEFTQDCGCPADFNNDGFVSGDDFDLYVAAFELGDPSADFNGDGFVSGDDFDAFVLAFEAGC